MGHFIDSHEIVVVAELLDGREKSVLLFVYLFVIRIRKSEVGEFISLQLNVMLNFAN
jgi:hypothetical protein